MTNFDAKKFQALFPRFFSTLEKDLSSHGYHLTLVGGVVRDFFLTGKLGHDWDIEVSHDTLAFNQNDWKALSKSLSKLGKTVFLPYDIIRLEVDGYQLEFSPPRIETFEDTLHHKNFTAEFDFKLPFEKAILRRDFTINSMGVRSGVLLDPLGGFEHLRNKLLYACGTDFAKDPVRFLRAHRFEVKYNLNLSADLKKTMDQMLVQGFAPVHLWNELQKSGKPILFMQKLLAEGAKHPEMKLPLTENFLSHTSEFSKILINSKEHESWMIALEWVGLSGEIWQQYFSQSSESSKRLNRWAHASREFHKIRPEEFHGEFEDVLKRAHFDLLFDWYFTTKQLLQKNPELPLLKMIEEYLPDWIHLYRFEAVKDVKHIDPPLRAKYQVYNLCQRL